METTQQKISRLKALREARDGTTEQQKAQARAAAKIQAEVRNAKAIRRLVLKLERSIGERIPAHIRNKVM